MKKISLLVLLLICTIVFCLNTNAQVPAFPGADGFGRYTSGGRGGTVYYVTTLEDTGKEGSFRYAVGKSNAIVLFKVSGTIHLNSRLSITGNNLTIAGQSAPGDGICLADYPVSVSASNVIVRYLRFRMGDYKLTAEEADGGDAFGGRFATNVIIDHCSVSWSTDECCSFYANTNFTMQWCLIAESLCYSLHSKGAHGYGAIWGGVGASYYHNMLIHHSSRTPRFGTGNYGHPNTHLTDWRNNVIYNWSGNGCYGCEGMYINTVNNYYRPGPATTSSTKAKFMMPGYATSSDGTTAIWGKYYFSGNRNDLYTSVNTNNWNGVSWTNNSELINGVATQATLKSDTALGRNQIPLFHQHTTDSAYIQVLKYVGCSKSRDALDTRYVTECKNRTSTYKGSFKNLGGIIDKCDDLKPYSAGADWTPWPTLNSTTAPTDTDGDGMPDDWETAHGLNPNDKTDGNTRNSEGYTNLEVYLNSLVADITEGQYEGSTEMGVKGEPYDPHSLSTDATIKWPMHVLDAVNGESSDKTIIASGTYEIGNKLTKGTLRKFDNVYFTMFVPKEECKARNADACVCFNINLAEGVEAKLSELKFSAIRAGTDGGSVDAVWVDSNGNETSLVKNIKPVRNSGDSPLVKVDLSEITTQTCKGNCKLFLYLYNLGTTKSAGYADVEIGLNHTNKIPTILGDANGDGMVDVADITAIATHILDNTFAVKKGADANKDGIVDVADITTVAYFILNN